MLYLLYAGSWHNDQGNGFTNLFENKDVLLPLRSWYCQIPQSGVFEIIRVMKQTVHCYIYTIDFLILLMMNIQNACQF